MAELLGDGPDPERALLPEEVAMLFQVSERTVSEWGRRGRIPIVQEGRQRRYPAAAVRDLLIEASDGDPSS